MSADGEVAGLSYTLGTYSDLLERFVDAGYRFEGFDVDRVTPRTALLRHDVDLSPERALAMARTEASRGIQATYFFSVTAPVYDLLDPGTRRVLEAIEREGHDVGLHFDVREHWDERPDDTELRDAIRGEAESLDRLVSGAVETVSFHDPPAWVLEESVEGFTSALEPRFAAGLALVSDANQRWREADPFADGLPRTVQLVVHPGLWHDHERDAADIVEEADRRTRSELRRYVATLDA